MYGSLGMLIFILRVSVTSSTKDVHDDQETDAEDRKQEECHASLASFLLRRKVFFLHTLFKSCNFLKNFSLMLQLRL